eukprot:SAG22_NODE_898_length_6620_cov_13.916884_4_plen_122_part_00
MADTNYFLEIEPECVKFVLNQLGYEEVGRAACVCREFYKELTPRAKTIAHTIQCVEKEGSRPSDDEGGWPLEEMRGHKIKLWSKNGDDPEFKRRCKETNKKRNHAEKRKVDKEKKEAQLVG